MTEIYPNIRNPARDWRYVACRDILRGRSTDAATMTTKCDLAREVLYLMEVLCDAHLWIYRMADRIHKASEVLSRVAERKRQCRCTTMKPTGTKSTGRSCVAKVTKRKRKA